MDWCDATTTVAGFGCPDGTIRCEMGPVEHDYHFNRSHCRTGHSWSDPQPQPTATVTLPEPDGTRGSGAPWWRVGTPLAPVYASVSPVEDYNLPDPEVPCLSIAVHSGLWPLDQARALAAAILAAIEAQEAGWR